MQLEAGAVVLGPVADALIAVVVLHLVDPALAHEGHVAHDARRREAGQVAHDVVLELLRLGDADAPVLGVRDHVAHVEVVGHDRGVVEQAEAQVEELLRRGIGAPQQHALVAHVAEAHLEQLARRLSHQGRHLVGVVGVGVERQARAALARFLRQALQPLHHVVLQEVLRDAHQALGGQADVADVGDLEQGGDEGFQELYRKVRDVAARDHHVAHRRGLAQVVENLLVAFLLRGLEAQLRDLRHVVAHQVHARAMPAVLRAGLQHFGQDLGGVAVGEALHHPHVGLVKAVAAGVGVARPLRVPVVEGGQHVAPDRVFPEVFFHGVDHLGRDQHRHRGSLLDVLVDVLRQVVGQQGTHHLLELLQVLDGVLALPKSALPLGLRDVLPTGEAAPVRLRERFLERVLERLVPGSHVSRGLPDRANPAGAHNTRFYTAAGAFSAVVVRFPRPGGP